MNENKLRGVFYVYYEKTVGGVTRRVNVGRIDADGSFTYQPKYLQQLKQQELEAEIQSLREQVHGAPEARKEGQEIVDALSDAAKRSQIDRWESNASIPMSSVLTCAVVGILGGANDCQGICEFIEAHRNVLEKIFGPNFAPFTLSREMLRRVLFMADPKSFGDFVGTLVGPMLLRASGSDIRVISADGQAARSASKRCDRDLYLMNVWDSDAQAIIGQEAVAEKTNEIKALPALLRKLNIQGAVITTDALNTQIATAEVIMELGADYCLAVKENQPALFNEVRALFNGIDIDPSHISEYKTEVELEHGRIEQRTTRTIPGRFCSKSLKDKWPGLGDGVLVMTTTESENKKRLTRREPLIRYFICSLPPVTGTPKRMGEIVRKHWRIENNLHWMMDVQFDQDRMNATNATFVANMNLMRKLVLSMLYKERARLRKLGEPATLKGIRQRCCNPVHAVELLKHCLLG